MAIFAHFSGIFKRIFYIRIKLSLGSPIIWKQQGPSVFLGLSKNVIGDHIKLGQDPRGKGCIPFKIFPIT